MIKPHCFGKDWFQSMSKKYRYNDLGIIEKVIRAFALLDLLARSGWKRRVRLTPSGTRDLTPRAK